MTNQSENDSIINEINGNDQLITVTKESSSNESGKTHEESTLIDTNEQQSITLRHNSTHEAEEKNNINDDTEINSKSTTKVDTNEEHEQLKEEITVNNHEVDHRTRRLFTSKYKYSSIPYYRTPYYTNGHAYGPAPCYYYPVAPITEKPPPLMVVPTQPPPSSTTTTTVASSLSPPPPPPPPTTTDNQTSNSTTTTSSQNLPPRLRQISANENDSNSQQASTMTTSQSTTTNGRRHRSILPRGSSNYYSQHPPPPLMATPPGVLFPYPPTFHQPDHVAYNIRTLDELQLLALQQQVMNTPPPLVWPPPMGYSPYPPYSIYDQSSYLYNSSSGMNSNSSLLNPEAAEWVPTTTDTDASTSDNNILIDDEINFPPLNVNRIEEHNTEQQTQVDSQPETNSTTQTEDKTSVTSSKIDATITNSSSSQDDNKKLSSSKSTTISYSNVIQALDANKSNKTLNNNTQNQRRPQQQQQSTNNVQAPLQARDRTNKQQKSQATVNSKDIPTRRRPLQLNRNNLNGIRNPPPAEIPKQQQNVTDDWIEVKSKKTKKFDRSITDIPYENSTNISKKSLSDQHITKTLSPLSSASDNTVGTFTSEEDDDKDDLNILSDNKSIVVDENKAIITSAIVTTEDCNQIIIDNIHGKLNNKEQLLILLRGCPGSGKSTLAKALNNTYNGEILSADEYRCDPTKLETAYLYTRGLASDAVKKRISPIIIDNTNSTSWEMKPYIIMGKEADYDILIIEPQTAWRYKARELAKRNQHDVPLRRIKEMLSHFEHNLTVENIVGETKTSLCITSQLQNIVEQQGTNTESIDPILTSKKSFKSIDDSNILNDVRLCINDMILFITSSFYQTSQSSTSLSLSFSDLSCLQTSSSPTTPTTPHSLFHRSLSRFSSTTSSQDHSFSNEHLLRLPTTIFPRCIEKLTPPCSINSSIITGKKKRKNKNKQQHQSNEILLNTNNNNNNIDLYSMVHANENYLQQFAYDVVLSEDSQDFIIIDEQNYDDCCDSFIQSFDQQRNSQRNHSSVNPNKINATNNKNDELLNIIRSELTQAPVSIDRDSSKSLNHVAIQCSLDEFHPDINPSDRILVGHLSTTQANLSPPISIRAGYLECGIQVDLNENTIHSLLSLIELYSNQLSAETIKQFYDICNADIQSTRIYIEEHLKHNHEISIIPTLRQLSLNALNQWNDNLRHSNPSFDSISIADLLQDINDDDVYEDIILDTQMNNNFVEFTDSNQIKLPWSLVSSLQELYGELSVPLCDTTDGLSLPIDDELSINMYQALQRFLGIPNKISTPVNEKKLTKENKKLNKQRWNLPSQNESNTDSNKKTSSQSFKKIMDEELTYINRQKSVQKPQLDFASQHKLKELERYFPNLSSDVIYEMFRENECDYDLTLACISSMLDENAPIIIPAKSPSFPVTSNTHSKQSTNSIVEPVHEYYQTSRRDARLHAAKRKEYFNKADQANRHGMVGVASYYINQAREQTRYMKDANRTACEYLSKQRLVRFRQTHQLDLHELYPEEALLLFKQVEQELSEGNRRTTPKSIEVITGYGKSSAYGGGCGKIRSIIVAYLRQKNYKYSEPNKGAILVQF